MHISIMLGKNIFKLNTPIYFHRQRYIIYYSELHGDTSECQVLGILYTMLFTEHGLKIILPRVSF